ncbi:hypothetical protein D3C81_1435180 [compost metagenome]
MSFRLRSVCSVHLLVGGATGELRVDLAVFGKSFGVEARAAGFEHCPAAERMAHNSNSILGHCAEFFWLSRHGIDGAAEVNGALPQLRRCLRAAVATGGAGVVDRRDDVTLMGQCTGQPCLVDPATAIAVGQHYQWMLALGGRGVEHRRRTDEDRVVAEQLWRRSGGRTRVPDDHFYRALIARIRQRGVLETNGLGVSEGVAAQADQ